MTFWPSKSAGGELPTSDRLLRKKGSLPKKSAGGKLPTSDWLSKKKGPCFCHQSHFGPNKNRRRQATHLGLASIDKGLGFLPNIYIFSTGIGFACCGRVGAPQESIASYLEAPNSQKQIKPCSKNKTPNPPLTPIHAGGYRLC